MDFQFIKMVCWDHCKIEDWVAYELKPPVVKVSKETCIVMPIYFDLTGKIIRVRADSFDLVRRT